MLGATKRSFVSIPFGADGADADLFAKAVADHPDGVALIEGNHPPGDPSSAYGPGFVSELAKAPQVKIILLSDLLAKPPDRYALWLVQSDLIVGFHDAGVRWAERQYGSRAFRHAPSLPVVYEGPVHLNSFRKLRFDFGYIGSDKEFRLNFLRRVVSKAAGRYEILAHAKKLSETELVGTRECSMRWPDVATLS